MRHFVARSFRRSCLRRRRQPLHAHHRKILAVSTTSRIDTVVTENGVRTSANQVRVDGIDVRSPGAMVLAREWFAAGVAATKQEQYAAAIGVTPSVLSEMVSGKRPRQIHLVQVLPLLASFGTAQPFVGWACRLARMVEPLPVDTLTLSTSEARLLGWMRRTAVWTLFLGELIAREFYRCELDLLDAAITASAK